MYIATKVTKQQLRFIQQLRLFAKTMRKQPTPAEARLWKFLCKSKINHLRFRRQHPLFSYIVDFYCHAYKLVIEVDGEVHEHQLPRDQSRDAFLKRYGYTVLRFTNEQVLNDTYIVLENIMQTIHLLPRREKVSEQSEDG